MSQNQPHVLLWSKLFYPLKHFSLAAVVFLEIGTTLDRFISVRTPIKHEEDHVQKKYTLCKIFTPVAVMSILLAIPRGLESQLTVDFNRENLTITPASLKFNQTYAKVIH